MSNNIADQQTKAVPYVLRQGEGQCFMVAGQVVRVLAGIDETVGGYGAMVCEATLDRQAIPLHYHEREHDTWFCTRGRLRIWADGISRMLTEGDFAYVRPNHVHSYQSIAPRTQFFGIVAPGGWEGFFESAGGEWSEPGLPPVNHPFDFSRMGGAMQRFGVMRVPDAVYADVSSGDATDRVLPEEPRSYVLQAGYGKRSRLNAHLSTQIMAPKLSDGCIDMRTIEAGRGAKMPTIQHDRTHLSLYLLEGRLRLVLDGDVHELEAGDFANIPAGTGYSTEVLSGHASWLLTAAHGSGLNFWDDLGQPTEEFTFAVQAEASTKPFENCHLPDVKIAAL